MAGGLIEEAQEGPGELIKDAQSKGLRMILRQGSACAALVSAKVAVFSIERELVKVSVLAVLFCLVSPSLFASKACPLMLVDGEIRQDSLDVSVRNKGKLPVEEFELAVAGVGARHPVTHDERGLFYPGSSYDINFAYPGRAVRAARVSLQTARLSDGSVWLMRRDETCRPLKVLRKQK